MRAVGAAAAAGVLVGAAMVASRFAVDQVPPAGLALLRYLIGALCLLPLFLASRREKFAARDLLPICLLGIFQFGVLIALLNFALQHVPAGRVALIFACFPLFTLLLGAALGRERLSLAKLTGVLLTLLGVAIALGETALAEKQSGLEWLGILAVFASVLTGAVCSVFYRPYVERYPTLQVSFVAMLAAVGFLILLAFPEGFYQGLPRIDGTGWAAVLFIGLASAVGYYLWLWALAHTTATRVTVFLALSPLSAALLGAWFLGEALTLSLLAALLCVAGGLWLAHRD